MRYAIIIENEQKLLAQISEAILQSDPKIIIRNFPTFEGFEKWVLLLKQTGPSAINQAGFTIQEALENTSYIRNIDEIRKKSESKSIKVVGKELSEHLLLFIANAESLPKKRFDELRNFLKICSEVALCTNETPTSVLLTAFESPNFKIKEFAQPCVFNVIFKPFDKPILNQIICFALNGNQEVKSEFVFQQKTKANVEMIKESEIEGFSEVGLVTINDKKLKPGSLSKLYTKVIETPTLKSTFAVCTQSDESKEDPKLCLSYFKFFALKNDQINVLRKFVKETTVIKLKEFPKPPITDNVGRFFHIGIISIDETSATIEEILVRTFKMLKVSKFKDNLEFIKAIKASPESFDAVIFINSFFVDDPEKQTKNFKDFVSSYNPLYSGDRADKFPIFIISSHIYPRETEKQYAKFVSNIFYLPLDKSYFIKLFYFDLNFLSFNETTLDFQYVPSRSLLKIGSTVETIDLSEAAINFHYNRSMVRGDFRKFILTTENETDIMELLGRCNFVKENKDRKCFDHQFIFFALNDSFLKAIRIWIRNTYIQSKEGA